MRKVLVLAVMGLVALGCSSDSDESTCESLQTLSSSMDELVQLSSLTGGTDTLNERLEAVETDLGDVESSTEDQFESESEALNDALDEVNTSLENFDETGIDGVTAAVEGAVTAWDDLIAAVDIELDDCSLTPASIST